MGSLRWGDFKPRLADALVAHLQPIQARYAEVSSDEGALDAILAQVHKGGERRGRELARRRCALQRAAAGSRCVPAVCWAKGGRSGHLRNATASQHRHILEPSVCPHVRAPSLPPPQAANAEANVLHPEPSPAPPLRRPSALTLH